MDENMDLTKNPELNEALNEFKAKEVVQAPQTSLSPEAPEVPKMVQSVMRWFKVEQRIAEYILLGLVAVMIIFSLFLFFGGSSSPEANDFADEIFLDN